jgi:hypothetical protein
MHTMTKRQVTSGTIDVKALLAEDEEFLRALVWMSISPCAAGRRRPAAVLVMPRAAVLIYSSIIMEG